MKGIMYQPPILAYLKTFATYAWSNNCVIYLQPILCWHHIRRILLFATTRIGVQPPENSPTSPNAPPSIFARDNRCPNARHSSGTTAMDNNDMTVKGLRRLFLFPHLDGRQFRPPSKIACNPKTLGDCPRFQNDIAVSNVRLPGVPFCLTALWLPF